MCARGVMLWGCPVSASGKSVVATLTANSFQFRHDADLLIWIIIHLSRVDLGGMSIFSWKPVIGQGSAHSTTLRLRRNSPDDVREDPDTPLLSWMTAE